MDLGLLDRLLGRSFEALRGRGDRLFERGEYGLARMEYQAAVGRAAADEAGRAAVEERLRACNATLFSARTQRAAALEDGGHGEEAAQLYREALELAGDDGEREQAFLAIRRVEARLEAEAAAEDEPLEAEGADFLGDCVEDRLELHLLALDDDELAAEYRSLGPELAAAFVALEEGRGEEAVGPLEALLAEGAPLLVRRELGRALALVARAGEAVPHLRAWLDEAPEDVPALHALADALAEAEGLQAAVDALAPALDARPDAVTLRLRLAELLLAQEEAGEAIELLEEGVAEAPGTISLHRALGVARAAAGNSDGARAAWETALSLRWRLDNDTGELEFDRESAWFLAQLMLARKADAHRALDLISALALSGDEGERPGLLVAKAQAHGLLGDRDAARQALVTARTLAGEDDEAGRKRIDELLAQL